MGPTAAILGDGSRLHLQHGPIDLIIGADPVDLELREVAFCAAVNGFENLLDELVSELPLLRSAMSMQSSVPKGSVARRMERAVRIHGQLTFVTPMAAVAGSVADEILAVMVAAVPLNRAYVNNGGDIALHLAPGASFTAAMATINGAGLGRIAVLAETSVRGIATSGQGGRSLSLGIADSVTVLAENAAAADVAATLIASAVNLPHHPAIRREVATDLQPDSDLGERLVVTGVGVLTPQEVTRALNSGATVAQEMMASGLIYGAALFLRGSQRILGAAGSLSPQQVKRIEHA